MKHFLHIISILLLFVLSQFVAAVVAFLLKLQECSAAGISIDLDKFDWAGISSVNVGRGTLVASALLVAVMWCSGLAGRKVLGVPRTLTPLAALLGAVGFLLLAHGISFMTAPLGLDDFGTTKEFEEMTKDFWGVLAICAVVPAAEEMIFRAGILRKLRQAGISKWAAIIMSAVVFGLFHRNPLQAVPAVIMGVALGWLYTKTDSLVLCLLAHMVNNSLACLEMQFPRLEDFLTTWPAVWTILLGLFVAELGRRLLAHSLRHVEPDAPAHDAEKPVTTEEIAAATTEEKPAATTEEIPSTTE